MVIPFVRSKMENLSFHDRMCFLLREQRLLNNKSLEEVATAINASPEEVASWEAAKVSPPANKYHGAVSLIGLEAYYQASKLWFQAQMARVAAYLKRRTTDQHVASGEALGVAKRNAA